MGALRVEARVVNLDGKTLDVQTHRLGVEAVSATAVCKVEPPEGERVYFVDLRLPLAPTARRSAATSTGCRASWTCWTTRTPTGCHTPVREFADLHPAAAAARDGKSC
jgi:hypothetical protein